MIPRYTPEAFAALWSPSRRYAVWLEVELAACEAMEAEGLVPQGTAERVRALGLQLDPARIDEIERRTRHDVIAFLTHVEELAGEPARWLHRGMTSSDVLDTSLALLLRDAAELCIARLQGLLGALRRRVEEHRRTPMIGRTHGIHAEPVTFGLALAGHYAELHRALGRLRAARDEVSVGTLSGAVGTYAHLSPALEARALGALGLRTETVPTQVVPRDRHAAYFAHLAVVGGAIERLAIQIRHWQRTEVLEAEEAFSEGQKGSSAMPHKRNPILSENLCGLARMLRAWAGAALENTALWHERDISHSSAERFLAPDATTTLGFMLERATRLVEGLQVYPDALRAHLDHTGGLWASEAVLLALVETGLGRQEGYVLVQRNAMRAWRREGDFRALLAADPEVGPRLGEEALARCFDLAHTLRHADAVIDRALSLAALAPGDPSGVASGRHDG
ncbi:MAG: adenylosuccinate lyase [Deltaproteobacteria bacterium]|nr:adenylosuccinate lyase [Deltaproteobacteria bacterium]